MERSSFTENYFRGYDEYSKTMLRIINGLDFNCDAYLAMDDTSDIDIYVNKLLPNYSKNAIEKYNITKSLRILFMLAKVTDEAQNMRIEHENEDKIEIVEYSDLSSTTRMYTLLNRDPSFILEPASAKYHGNFRGGLLKHSLNVLKCAIRMAPIYNVDYKTLDIIAILFHDLCKVGKYIFKQYKNENNEWNETITYNKDESCIEHGAESLRRMLNAGIYIDEPWQIAIAYHMGVYNASNVETINFSKMASKYPEVLLMHHADALSAAVYEKENKTDN